MSEIVPPEVRPKPAVPAKPFHVAPPSGGPFVPSPQGTGGEGQGSGRGSALFGYIGIDTIIEQMRKKTMKTGFDFNIMVVGGWESSCFLLFFFFFFTFLPFPLFFSLSNSRSEWSWEDYFSEYSL